MSTCHIPTHCFLFRFPPDSRRPVSFVGDGIVLPLGPSQLADDGDTADQLDLGLALVQLVTNFERVSEEREEMERVRRTNSRTFSGGDPPFPVNTPALHSHPS